MKPQHLLSEENLTRYLEDVGILPRGATAEVLPAGDGNINWVRRVRTPERSWVVKQARPALERFPEYEASTERIAFEHRYYECVAPLPGSEICPRIDYFDECERVLVMEWVDGRRLDAALEDGASVTAPASRLAAFLGAVHGATTDPALAERFKNDEMRRLHGAHIFELPLRENDFPLEPEVRAAAQELAADGEVVSAADAAHARYLEPRGSLVHADVQSSNILLAAAGPKLLDAEIAHVGDPAFDVGILLAHLLLPELARGAGPGRAGDDVAIAWSAYVSASSAGPAVQFADVARYAGIEMLRRTIGAARVPRAERPAAALAILATAREWIVAPPGSP